MTPTVHGQLRRRLLVNVLVDPDEAADRLPSGVRPHVAEGGTVVGCCLLDIRELRPSPLPRQVGVGIRAAESDAFCSDGEAGRVSLSIRWAKSFGVAG